MTECLYSNSSLDSNLFFVCRCFIGIRASLEDKSQKLKILFEDEYAQKKKTDEPTPDDPHSSEESEDTDEEQLPEENQEQPPNLENEEVSSILSDISRLLADHLISNFYS